MDKSASSASPAVYSQTEAEATHGHAVHVNNRHRFGTRAHTESTGTRNVQWHANRVREKPLSGGSDAAEQKGLCLLLRLILARIRRVHLRLVGAVVGAIDRLCISSCCSRLLGGRLRFARRRPRLHDERSI